MKPSIKNAYKEALNRADPDSFLSSLEQLDSTLKYRALIRKLDEASAVLQEDSNIARDLQVIYRTGTEEDLEQFMARNRVGQDKAVRILVASKIYRTISDALILEGIRGHLQADPKEESPAG